MLLHSNLHCDLSDCVVCDIMRHQISYFDQYQISYFVFKINNSIPPIF